MRVFLDSNLLIYLNTIVDTSHRVAYETFYKELVLANRCFLDTLVLEETLYVSYKKYGVPYSDSIEMIESQILPYAEVISLGLAEYLRACELLLRHNLKPSDSLHLSSMSLNNIGIIISEDLEFDDIEGIKRIWLGTYR